jgi:hypothetical protein
VNKKKPNRDEVRENSLTIPMSKLEKDRVQKKANEMGISMSALGRVVLSDFFKKEERF